MLYVGFSTSTRSSARGLFFFIITIHSRAKVCIRVGVKKKKEMQLVNNLNNRTDCTLNKNIINKATIKNNAK